MLHCIQSRGKPSNKSTQLFNALKQKTKNTLTWLRISLKILSTLWVFQNMYDRLYAHFWSFGEFKYSVKKFCGLYLLKTTSTLAADNSKNDLEGTGCCGSKKLSFQNPGWLYFCRLVDIQMFRVVIFISWYFSKKSCTVGFTGFGNKIMVGNFHATHFV